MRKLIAWLGAIVFGYLAYTAAYMGGIDNVTVGFGLLCLVCIAVGTSKGGGTAKSPGKGKRAKANA